MRSRSGWIWGGRIAALVVLAGLAVYLASVGLDKADKLASILGLLVALATLVAPYLLPSSDESRSKPGSSQQVANAVVGGHLTQIRDAKGGVYVKGSVRARPTTKLPHDGDAAPEGQRGQYVNGVWVGGNLTQIDGVNGDTSIG